MTARYQFHSWLEICSQAVTLVILFASTLRSEAILDLDGNGVSELWQMAYPSISALETVDSDYDGQSNLVEALAGTDPTSSASVFRVTEVERSGDTVNLRWQAIVGKRYTVQRLDPESVTWSDVGTLSPGAGDAEIELPLANDDALRGIFRLSVSDEDQDGDGLTAWEEAMLGFSDDSMTSSGTSGRLDFIVAVGLIEGEEGFTLADGRVLTTRKPTSREAARFLVQASFGPNMESIDEVCNLGIFRWLDAQIALPQTLTRTVMWSNGQNVSSALWKHGWFKVAVTSEDQLRQRLAYALSQILVINGNDGSIVGDNALTQANYYDLFIKNNFGDYRDVLEDVTYSPVMGAFLSYLKNRKADLSINRFPDENFAREIMQLFSIGLWKLNLDGTHDLDGDGDSQPTYDNSIITEMAKIFTGMSFSRHNGVETDSYYGGGIGSDYLFPMKAFDVEHEPGPKKLFNEVVILGGQSAEEDVQQTLDELCAHTSMPPFISRLLIQRFTSSNPSPEYLRRVSMTWVANNGNLGEVIRAILLDPEARNIDLSLGKRGKVREPLMRMMHLARAFHFAAENGHYVVVSSELLAALGQYPLQSNSVFNFYLPDYSPAGILREEEMVSPELELATTSVLLDGHNFFRNLAGLGYRGRTPDYTFERSLTDDPDALIEHLDILLTYGTLAEPVKNELKGLLANLSGSAFTKVAQIVHLISISPDYCILK